MRVFLRLLAIAVTFCGGSLAAPHGFAQTAPQRQPDIAGLAQDRLARLTSLLRADVAEGRIPGAVILVARDGQIALFEAVGYRDRAREIPMTKDAIFRIYSMTKPIVSAAAMMLVEEGKIQLTDPVALHIPELKDMKVGVERTDPEGKAQVDLVTPYGAMTVRDLLRHTSGIPYGFYGRSLVKQAYVQANLWDSKQTSGEFIAKLTKLALVDQPGVNWEYGLSTDVLGVLLERVEGKPLDMVLEERIFRPLGMKDTGFYVPEGQVERIAGPLETAARPLGLLEVARKPNFLAGGHGLVSTAEDYLKFASMMLNGGALDGTRILGRATVDYMTSDHIGTLTRPSGSGPGPGYGFGLGVAVRLQAGAPTYPGSVGDFQWGGYAGTMFWVDPRERLVAVFMVQAPNQLGRYAMIIRTMVYAAIVK